MIKMMPIWTLKYIPPEKIEYVQDGQKVMFGNDELYFTTIPGHKVRCGVMFYRHGFFSGDALGSGDILLAASLYEFRRSMKRFALNMDQYKKAHGYKTLTMYPGHLENKDQFQDDYVYDMLACAEGAIDGSIVTHPFPAGWWFRPEIRLPRGSGGCPPNFRIVLFC